MERPFSSVALLFVDHQYCNCSGLFYSDIFSWLVELCKKRYWVSYDNIYVIENKLPNACIKIRKN